MPKKNKPRQPTARHFEVASNIKAGMSPAKACRAAGFSESTIKTGKLMRTQEMAIALAQIGAQIAPGQLGNIARVRLREKLVKPPKDERVALGYVRTGLEVDGAIGGSPSELHLHQHNEAPPAVQKLMDEALSRMFGGKAIDAKLPEAGE
jgi:hypothetical protein